MAKPITPPSKTASEEDSDPDKLKGIRMCKRIWLLLQSTSRRSTNPPTTTSEHPQTPRTRIQSGQFGNQRTVNVVGAGEKVGSTFGNQRTVNVVGAGEKVGSTVVQKSGIQCFNCKEYGHFAKECRKPKRVKDSTYHMEKMLLCKQAEQVSNTCLVETDDSNVILDSPDMCEDDIQNEQNDVESDDERVALANLIANLKLDVNENKKIQNQLKKENTTLAQELKECKAILAKTTLGQLAHKDTVIREGLKTKAYELSVVKEKHDELMKQSLLTKSPYEGLVKKKTKVITDLKLREEHDIEKILPMEKQLKFLNEVVYKRSQSIQTIHMMAPKVSTYNGRPTFANPRYLKQAHSEIPCLYAFPYDQSTHANRLIPDGEETLALERENVMYSYLQSLSDLDALAELQCMYLHKVKECDCLAQKLSKQTESVSKKTLPQTARRAVSNTNVLKPGMYRIDNRSTQTRAPQLPQTVRNTNPRVSTSTGVNHNTNVSKPQRKSNQSRDKVVPNNSQVKVKETQVEVHPRIPSVSNKMKSVTACYSLNSRTMNANIVQLIIFIINSGRTKHMTGNHKLLCNFVEKFLGTVCFGNDQFAPILGYGDLVQGNVAINRVYYVKGLNHNLFSVGQFCDANLEVAFRKSTCFVRDLQGNDLLTEWSRFVTIVKKQHKLDEVSYYKLFDMLKQYQNEVNELRAERLARNDNPLALVVTAQANQDPYYQTSRSHKSHAPSSKPSIPTRSHTTTRHKGKEIAKPITPPSETASEEDNDPKQAQRDKDMQKNLALIAKYFKKIYKPTNNNLRTSSNSKKKSVDTTSRFRNDNQSGQFRNQRTVNVAGARENVGSLILQQSGIQCFNCKEFGHFAKECRKPKRVKDSTYHKEKILLCKQAEQGVPLQAEKYDWLADTDEEVDEHELEAHYSYMAKIQEVPTADSGTDSEPVE
nr:integrase, catalytic region, zinc finger, CCHC-type, peptidase aspartic, catalytic [Tanacetum cinerariifolium]